MRTIPAQITDSALRESLSKIDQEIDDKMKKVNTIRAAMKKKDLSATELQELKTLGTEIDQLDKKWKSLVHE